MVEINDRRLPVGIQSFEVIREGGYLYVDKTDIIWQLANRDKKYNYLSRPRRFGKSVLVDTLEAYFLGKKELFEGLKIMQMETEWVKRPVIRLDMSRAGAAPESVRSYLDNAFHQLESEYDIAVRQDSSLADRFDAIIQTAYNKTGLQVAILIDEYDSPLQHSWKTPQHEACTAVYREVFAILKADDKYEKFVFITGITKFTQISLFSVLNNLSNISFEPEYAAICGITKEEVLRDFKPEINKLAEYEDWTFDEAVAQLTAYYDGYHFTRFSPDIFNPYSLLNCLAENKFGSYWFTSGTPTYLINMMRKYQVVPTDVITRVEADASEFDVPTENMPTIMPLLYQSGYITIKEYHEDYNYYVLDVPNKEVKMGLTKALIPSYVTQNTLATTNTARRIAQALDKQNMEEALTLLQTFLGTVPYCNNAHYEGHYQQMLFIIFSLLTDYQVDVEVHTPNGRVDVVLLTHTDLFLLEIKLDRSAKSAMQQINLKNYHKRFALSGKPITKVGINFNSKTGNIDNWVIEKA